MIVTPFYAGFLALWFLVLSARVVLRRRADSVSLGDAGNKRMLRVMRGHANFAEYVPLALVMMAMLELGRTSTYILHALGLALLIGRLLHGYALSFTEKSWIGRFWGIALTFAVVLVAAVLCIWQGLRGFALT